MRFSLRVKLLAAFAAVLALVALLGLLAVTRLGAASDRIQELSGHRVPEAQLMGQATTIANKIRKDQLHYVLSTPADRPGVTEDLEGDDADLAAVVKQFRAGTPDARFAARLSADLKAYTTAATPFKGLADRGDTRAAGDLLSAGAPDKVWDDVKATMKSWQAAQAKAAAAYGQGAAEAADGARTTIVLALIVVALLAIAVALLLTRSVARSIAPILERLQMLRDHCAQDLRTGLERQAAGDLTCRITPVTPLIEHPGGDELGDIARAVNDIRDRTVASVVAFNASNTALTAMIGEVAESAGTLSGSSQQLAASSGEVGRAITEIAESISGVAVGAERQVRAVASAREVTEAVATATADGAREADDAATAAQQARALAAEGAGAVASATEAMEQVRQSSQEATVAIRELGAKSSAIGGIVATISGIAEQTNLLALNAAIEAARAGDQGRGFAVVADEVRKLAEESQEAAATIGRLIEEIQSETTRVVGVVEAGSDRTEGGAATVEQARASFIAIGESVEDVTDRVRRIAEAVGHIAESAARVQQDMGEVAAVAEESSAASEQVSAGTQQTSASTQEIADSAQALAGTAAHLGGLVERFMLTAAAAEER